MAYTYTYTQTRKFVAPDNLFIVDAPIALVANTTAVANTWYDFNCSGVDGAWPVGAALAGHEPSANYTVAEVTTNKITCAFNQKTKMELTVAGRIQSAVASTYEIDLGFYDDVVGNDPDDAGALVLYFRLDNVAHASISTFYIQQVVELNATCQLVLAIRSSVAAAITSCVDFLKLRRPS